MMGITHQGVNGKNMKEYKSVYLNLRLFFQAFVHTAITEAISILELYSFLKIILSSLQHRPQENTILKLTHVIENLTIHLFLF